MNINRLLNAANDCVIRFRSNHYPLKTVANDIIRARKLNSTDRKALLDIVFSWSKKAFLIKEFLLQKVRFFKGTPEAHKDYLALELVACELGYSSSPVEYLPEYQEWLKKLGDEQYLRSLGFIGEILKKDYGPFAKDIARGFFNRPKKYLAFDSRHLSLDIVSAALEKLSIKHQTHPIFKQAIAVDQINLMDLPKNISPHLWFMDAGSQIICEILSVKPADLVLDMCAGEGGKALFITGKECHYVAMDIDEARLKVAKARLFGRNVEFIKADATTYDFSRLFDWILIDAPCSGSGVLRRNPDLIHRLGPSQLSNYIEIQSKLLKKATHLLKPQGKLIYATCSLFKAENEEQISKILTENKEIIPLPLNRLVGERLMLPQEDLVNNCLTLYPHIHDCDGFFVAALSKGP